MKVFKKILKWLLVAVASLLVLFTIVPYLIPLKNLPDFNDQNNLYPNSEYHDYQGVKIHYRKFPAKEVRKGNIMMVHGFSGSTFSWRKNVDFLQNNGYQVVCVDLPGLGFSDRKLGLNHSPENRSKWLWDIADKIEKEGKWHLIGHSMGASVVVSMGCMRPEQTESVVCVDGLYGRIKISPFAKWIFSYPPVLRTSEIALQYYFSQKEKFASILKSAYSAEPKEEDVEGYLKPLLVKDAAKSILGTFSQSSDWNPDITKIQDKMFVIWGKNDRWIPLEVAFKFQKKFPLIPLEVIENAGHCPMETHQEEFHNLVLKFLKHENIDE